jgi:hypothetical protein
MLGCLAVCAALWPIGRVHAQGVTTGAVTGTITDAQGAPLAGAQVQIINRSTGFSTGTLSRSSGLFLVQGLEVGGPYTVRVQMIGYATQENNDVRVTLSQATRVDFHMSQEAVAVAGIEVLGTASRGAEFSPTKQGVSTLISDSMISKLPTLSRDFLDLVKLAPQVTKPQDGNGFSAGGQYNRFNSYTIDGANQQDRFNLNSSGSVPGGAANAKLVSQDAVKEIRVSFTPTDVRQGNFTGLLVNAVTKNGTNEFKGGATLTYRASDISASPIRNQDLSVKQYGFNLGGPIIKDKLHFFVAPEWQSRSAPASGPYLGATDPLRTPTISQDTINAVIATVTPLFDPGATGLVSNKNPLTNLFGRIDYQINQHHRLVARQIWNKAENDNFSRNFSTFANDANRQNSGFRLASNGYTAESKNASSVLQLYSNFTNGWQNEFITGYNKLSDVRIISTQTPEISVGVTPIGGTSPNAAITFGTEQFSPGNKLEQKIFEAVDNLTIPMGSHTFTVGGRYEHDNIYNNFAQRSFGVWTFPTLTALRNRTPSGYTYGYSNSGNAADIAGAFNVALYSLYAQDQWSVNEKLTVTAGLRMDVPQMLDTPINNDTIAKYFAALNLKTSDKPKTQMLFSPRLGFNYDITGNRTSQLRGNVGIFTGPPPFILIGNAYQNTGMQLVTLVCTTAATVPAFTVDVNNLPKACNGQPTPAPGQAGTAGVNHTDPNFKYPQSYAISGGFDQRLPGNITATFEGLYRHSINGVLIRDLNLKSPHLVNGQPYTDRNGRVLYVGGCGGCTDSISATGSVTNNNRYLTSLRGVSFSEGMIDVTNQSRDYNWSLSGQLNKRFGKALELNVGYTYMQSKDVQSLTSDRAISNFRNGRQLATTHDDLEVGTSYFERPHRVVASAAYTAPWKLTTLSLYFQGISGTPFTYTVNSDINGDLVSGNDPIYIPVNATDQNEIRVGTGSGAAFVYSATEAQALEDFIASQPCLTSQRGQIMKRNSCRSPFQKTLDGSIRQAIPRLRGQSLSLQLDVFNLLNLLNKDWGALELPVLSSSFPQQNILTARGRTAGPLNQSYSNYTFDFTAAQRTGGPFQKQTSAANYWQMQMTLKYSF